MVGAYAGSNRMRVAAIALGILLCSAATAEPQPWMKKENPETLHSYVFVDPICPVSETEVREIVNGILIRSRLRPGDYLAGTEELGFTVNIDCLEVNEQSAFFRIDVFLQIHPQLQDKITMRIAPT